MRNEMKRRMFLASLLAVAGAPIVYRLCRGRTNATTSHRFTQELKQYRDQVQVSVTPLEQTIPVEFTLAPPIGRSWNYVMLSQTYFPSEVSTAVGNDPDSIFVREGLLYCEQTNKGQVVIGGGDQRAGVISPLGVDEKETKDVTILVRNGSLGSAKPRGTQAPSNQDIQLAHLMGLETPGGPLARTQQWRGRSGRVKPFVGYMTRYEVQGLADVGGVKTIGIAFSGNIPNIVGLPGVRTKQPENPAVSTNQHRGTCYFDLETGLLVRQETEMELVNSGIQGYKGKDGTDTAKFKSQFVIQLFQT